MLPRSSRSENSILTLVELGRALCRPVSVHVPHAHDSHVVARSGRRRVLLPPIISRHRHSVGAPSIFLPLMRFQTEHWEALNYRGNKIVNPKFTGGIATNRQTTDQLRRVALFRWLLDSLSFNRQNRILSRSATFGRMGARARSPIQVIRRLCRRLTRWCNPGARMDGSRMGIAGASCSLEACSGSAVTVAPTARAPAISVGPVRAAAGAPS